MKEKVKMIILNAKNLSSGIANTTSKPSDEFFLLIVSSHMSALYQHKNKYYVINPNHVYLFERRSLSSHLRSIILSNQNESSSFFIFLQMDDIIDHFPIKLWSLFLMHMNSPMIEKSIKDRDINKFELINSMAYQKFSSQENNHFKSYQIIELINLQLQHCVEHYPEFDLRDHSINHYLLRFLLEIDYSNSIDNSNSGINDGQEIDTPDKDLDIRPILNKYLKKRFKLTTAYLEKKARLYSAKELLNETDYSIKEISYMLGYSVPSHFIRFFKRNAGVTPNKYRILIKNIETNINGNYNNTI